MQEPIGSALITKNKNMSSNHFGSLNTELLVKFTLGINAVNGYRLILFLSFNYVAPIFYRSLYDYLHNAVINSDNCHMVIEFVTFTWQQVDIVNFWHIKIVNATTVGGSLQPYLSSFIYNELSSGCLD